MYTAAESWWPQACESCELILTCHIFAIFDLKIPGSYNEPSHREKKISARFQHCFWGEETVVLSKHGQCQPLFDCYK